VKTAFLAGFKDRTNEYDYSFCALIQALQHGSAVADIFYTFNKPVLSMPICNAFLLAPKYYWVYVVIISINFLRALIKEEKVALIGFGTFTVTKRAARTGRNPQTGKETKIEAKKVPKFVAGQKLKDTVAL